MNPTPDMIEQAALWAAALDAGDMSENDREACMAWCAEHPLHRHTLDRMRAFDNCVNGAEDFERDALRTMLEQGGANVRRVGRAMFGIVILVTAGWAAASSDFVRDRFPDYQTGRGELRTIALEDGSELVVDTDGAVVTDVDGRRRQVRLIRGQLLARVAKGRTGSFVVETADGTATAIGTAFVVRREQGYTLVTVIESHVRVCPARAVDEARCRVLAAGERAHVTSTQVSVQAPVDPLAAAMWSSGWLEADDEDVADVLTELARYSARPIRFDPASLEGIRITGNFPLRDVDRAVEGVARTTGLQVRRSAQEILVTRRL